ncbi:MAG TPA: class I SAM-dependent methyltransferase [Gemmataceae bacterium]|jgi:ubiquinone/menaquinone biosynthesis C-methylase UbiE|nr:class I SAM-dependent methyltransferase [Gemmataceae bacterium]
MEGFYPNDLRLWPATALAPEVAAPVNGRALPGPHNPAEFADRLYACEALNPSPADLPVDEGAEPYSLQWFLDIENRRHSRHGRWIPRLLEFAKHANETLLGLGNGLGTDWLQYARHGAEVVVCTPSADQLALIRRNFELRGLSGRFVHAPPWNLPLEAASIDVACLSSLLDEVADPRPVIQEVYRVLKPGGKVLAVTSARYDVGFWLRVCFPWQGWLRRQPGPSEKHPGQFSARRLRKLFSQFVEHRAYKRQLRRSEVPHLWRWVPLPLLERLIGHFLVLKAFKPLSSAITLQAAA